MFKGAKDLPEKEKGWDRQKHRSPVGAWCWEMKVWGPAGEEKHLIQEQVQ